MSDTTSKDDELKSYYVTVDVFFMHHEEVEARNEEEAKELALNGARTYGMGEEVTVHSIEEAK
jgi:hypothetical protein